MAEFCRKCFENIYGDHTNKKVIMSSEKGLCEGCGNIDFTVDTVEEKGIIGKVVELVKKIGV